MNQSRAELGTILEEAAQRNVVIYTGNACMSTTMCNKLTNNMRTELVPVKNSNMAAFHCPVCFRVIKRNIMC